MSCISLASGDNGCEQRPFQVERDILGGEAECTRWELWEDECWASNHCPLVAKPIHEKGDELGLCKRKSSLPPR